MPNLSNHKGEQQKVWPTTSKEPEVVPWHQLHVDLIGPYKMHIKKYTKSKDVKKKYSYGV